MTQISRRNFLKGASLGVLGATGAGVLAACSPQPVAASSKEADTLSETGAPQAAWRTAPEPIADDEIAETYDCDVLVIGLGHAGCCALRAAAEAGAAVCAMQETPQDQFMVKGGQVGHINSEFLKSRGVPEVDVVEFVNDWQLHSNNRSNPGLMMNYAKHAGECFDWMIEGSLSDDEYATMHVGGLMEGGPYMRELSGLKTWVGAAHLTEYVERVLLNCVQKAEDLGGKVYWGTKGCQLITDESGAVVGAIGQNESGYVRVNTAKGVILATGGFGANQEMCNDLLYEIKETMASDDTINCMLDCDGSGIQMGYWAGGRIDPCVGTMDGIYWYPTDGPTDPIGATAALWLNAEGKRYSNEGFGSTEMQSLPGARQPEGMICTLFDDNIEDLLTVQAFGHLSFDYARDGFDALRATMAKAYAGGPNGSADEGQEAGGEAGTDKAAMGAAIVFAADDFETLGSYLGYEGDALKNFVASIERYNDLCEKGYDEDFGKDPSLMVPLKQPPFYGYAGKKDLGELMVTVGGLLVDADGAVLGDDYRPIKGLYAAGNASGGRFGWQYFTSISGQSLSLAQTLGMLAGQNAAAN